MRTVVAACSVLAVVTLAGCQKPVHFPAQSDPRAGSLQAAGAYDADHDGKLDFFTYADASGRVDRIAYDISGDQRPDQIVRLDEIPFAHCRHLVLVLDGFAYRLVKEYYDQGRLRVFHPPSRVVAPYPTMTDMCLQDAFGDMPCRAFEARYFDRGRNCLVGGKADYLNGKNEPCNRLLQYRAGTIWDAIGYLAPYAVFGKEINDAKRVFDRSETKEVMAYFSSSAGMGTRYGAEGQRRALLRIEQLVNQVLWETRGLTKVTMLSDHGHSYTASKRIDFTRALRQRGWRVGDSLREPNDVVYPEFGLVTMASFATRRPAALAADLAAVEGVQLASYAEGDAVVVLSADGGRSVIRRKAGGYRYEPTSGDPLKLKPVLATLQADADGAYDAGAMFTATLDHEYPAPLERLWRAHFALVDNPPDVIVSLLDGYFAGLASFAGSVTIASTHGGLNNSNSTAFIMSTAGPLPPAMRSADIPACMRALTGADWPMRKWKM